MITIHIAALIGICAVVSIVSACLGVLITALAVANGQNRREDE